MTFSFLHYCRNDEDSNENWDFYLLFIYLFSFIIKSFISLGNIFFSSSVTWMIFWPLIIEMFHMWAATYYTGGLRFFLTNMSLFFFFFFFLHC